MSNDLPATSGQATGDRYRALSELVADHVRTAILDGGLQPGERLIEDSLARELEVSRHPIREALRVLSQEGLVEISPRRGATVSSVTPREAGEAFEVLATLEGLASYLAATRSDAEVVADLTGIVTRARQAQVRDDLDQLAELNRDFHLRVLAAGGNRPLAEMVSPLRKRIYWYQAALARRRQDQSWVEHQEILDAIADGDPGRAEAVTVAHIQGARQDFLASQSLGPRAALPG